MGTEKPATDDDSLTPADYDEYGEEPSQDEEPDSPDQVLTDPV
jgi:hypothetical protein